MDSRVVELIAAAIDTALRVLEIQALMDKPAREFHAARAVVAWQCSLPRANQMTATIAADGRSSHWRVRHLCFRRELAAMLSLAAVFWLGIVSGAGLGGGAIAFF